MKKINKILVAGLLGVTALTGGLTLTGCSKEDDATSVSVSSTEALLALDDVMDNLFNADFVVSYVVTNEGVVEGYTKAFDKDTNILKALYIDGSEVENAYDWLNGEYFYYSEDNSVKTSQAWKKDAIGWRDNVLSSFQYDKDAYNSNTYAKVATIENGVYTLTITIPDEVDMKLEYVYDANKLIEVLAYGVYDSGVVEMKIDTISEVSLQVPSEYKSLEATATQS